MRSSGRDSRPAEVVVDADTEVLDIVVLNIDHVVRVVLTQNIFYENNI